MVANRPGGRFATFKTRGPSTTPGAVSPGPCLRRFGSAARNFGASARRTRAPLRSDRVLGGSARAAADRHSPRGSGIEGNMCAWRSRAPTAVASSTVASCSSGVTTQSAAVATFQTGSEPRLGGMRRVILGLIGLYVLTAVLTTAAEAVGVGRQCGCQPDCWCKRRGLRLFRWVAPIAHHSVDPDEKAARA
ncbi:MAG: hypothetical protein QOI08_2509 [Actinomycetota bacterium]|jgi:hypothetical protein|nr:hypothetical protein [Actinomycetota bacterium]